ncbi:MAG: DNA primase, partial [Campylobacterota bacterium]|nr:DNA primase [Campylobacterota bacterium]
MISQDSIEALKAQLDIVDVIGSYIEIKKAGANFKAPCPFHDEKSPSFVISPAKQIYHCFGCGAGGDSIKFTMEYEKLNYPEAIEKLADTYNFTLHYENNKGPKKEKSLLIDKLGEYYISLLSKMPTALSYLQERGIFESSIERFGIGYAPASQQSIGFLKQQMFTMPEAIELGVIGQGESNIYARFIERITFPIHTTNGTLVGFGGRTITGHQAKYVNSPQSRIFNKSRLLYAYHLAKETIYRKKEMIVTEGYLDVVMLHQAGFTQAVATLGTALTSDHLPLLRKGDPRIIMAYDGDNAGRAAALKAARLLSASGFNGGVVLFEGGLDPADMVKSGQMEALNHLFHKPLSFIEFVLTQTLQNYDLRDPKAKESALHECVGYLKTLSALLQEEYRPFLASILGISPSLVRLSRATTTQAPVQLSKHDIWELSLIKTLIEYPSFTNQILDYIKPSLLQYHREEFELALANQLNDPRLMAISVDTQINAFNSDDILKSELITFLGNYYSRELKKVMSQNTLKFEKKTFLIRSYRDKIQRLK